ncbi:ABC transporter substrate-binding protein [Synechococcus sp. Nb3U1]|uniref:ABC transporter substrate-binding protein n=1 Tax=Synechococcus sp. Nb3U1 TaxID=1914529 RepID=UPI001F455097|nr:ABC transporter substrate-binding protein [Synechococcus sp. Nb3U1]MCF2971493.1 ABC transporter substrate-binding protein [Synechococcus sp. Nb3U1]
MVRELVPVLAAVGLGLGLAVSTAAQERTPNDPRLFNPGQLTVATGDPVFPPWMLNDDPAGGEGFENGLVYALAAEMGFAPEDVVWVRESFEQSIAPGPKSYDFAIQQISVTEARSEVVTFSSVYYQPDKAVVALPDSPVVGASSFEELRQARWGATVGTTDLDYLENILGISNVAVYDDQAGVFQAMQGDLIDATVVALPTALFVTAVQVPEAKITALLPPDENDRGHGLLFEKDNPLVDWVNEALAAVIERGVVEDLTQTYLVGDEVIPEIRE